MTIAVTDNPAESRYELKLDGRLAGLILYRIHNGRISMIHTEINDEFGGQGLGGRLAQAALDDVRKRGLEVVPLCPFIAAYIRRHPEQYLELVTPSFRDRLRAPEPTERSDRNPEQGAP